MFGLVVFHGISTIVGYLMPDPLYTYYIRLINASFVDNIFKRAFVCIHLCTQSWLTELKQSSPVDWIKSSVRSSVFAPEFGMNHLKKAEEPIGRNVVYIAMTMKAIVRIFIKCCFFFHFCFEISFKHFLIALSSLWYYGKVNLLIYFRTFSHCWPSVLVQQFCPISD